MTQTLTGNHLTRILIVTCALLASVVLLEWLLLQHNETDTRQETTNTESAGQPLSIDTYTAPAFETFDEILARPLFTEGREPPEEEDNTGTVTEAPPPANFNLFLEGIAITPETRIAVVREISSKKLLRLAEGTEHQGWKLERVDATGAEFTHNGQTRTLTLDPENSSRRPASPLKNLTSRIPNIAGKPVKPDDISIKKKVTPLSPTLVPAP